MAEGFPTLVMAAGEGLHEEVDLTFQIEEGSPDVVVHSIEGALSTLVKAGASGAFPSAAASADQSRLILVHSPHYTNHEVKARVKATNCDPRCFQLLRNMVGRLVLEGFLVPRITARVDRMPGFVEVQSLVPDVYNMYQVYPAPSQYLTFEVEWLGTSFSKARRCLVECARSIEPNEVSEISEKVKSWGRLLEAGAFAMPVGFPDEVDVVDISASQFDDVTIEVAVSHFKASEAAWCPLLHMLDVASRRLIPVVKVIVE